MRQLQEDDEAGEERHRDEMPDNRVVDERDAEDREQRHRTSTPHHRKAERRGAAAISAVASHRTRPTLRTASSESITRLIPVISRTACAMPRLICCAGPAVWRDW